MPESDTRTGAPEAPLSERICIAVAFGFAGFTLCAHVVVAAGGSLRTLVALFATALVAALFVRRRLRGSDGTRDGDEGPESAAATGPERLLPASLEQAGLPIAVAAGTLALAFGSPITLWALLVAVLAAAAVPHLCLTGERREPALRSRGAELVLAATALACALYTLFVHRPDADDAFYINVAVAAVDHPGLPLLARDTLHGRFDLPIHYAAYRLHAVELWNGALSLLLRIPALYAFHWITAALAAAGVALAHATLFRRLAPRVWPWATLALVLVLGVVGETHRWYGNFAFVRMWQGKSIALFVFVPLVYAFAIDFARRPDRRGWLRLAAAQIAALGASATALWVAPIAAWLGLACVLRPDRQGLRRFAIGATASGYVLVAGLLVKSGMAESIPELAEIHGAGTQLAGALVTVFGAARLHTVAILCVFAAWACAPAGPARRFAIAVPLAVAVVLLNPFADAFVRANLTGPSYWRAMWALPAPILIALVLVAPLQRLPGRAGAAVFAALLAAFAFLVPRYTGFSEQNAAALAWPAPKLGSVHPWSRALNDIAPRQRVVAPPHVSAWIPVFHDHAYPMQVRVYLRPLRERIGEIAFRDRYVMTSIAGGDVSHPRSPQIFERGLELYDVQAVCLQISAGTETAREILRRSGFRKRIQGVHFEIWEREIREHEIGERAAP